MKLIKNVVAIVLFMFGVFCDVHCMCYNFGNEQDSYVVHKYKSDLHDRMTIQQWRNASLSDIADNIFKNKEITSAIRECQRNSLSRRLQLEKLPYPHVALARVVMTAFDNKWESYNIPKLFCSSIDGASAVERMPDPLGKVLCNIATGISPYQGSPCVFAHSERGIGVYLKYQLGEILKQRSNGDICIIQIKTSLPPCKDCQKFWRGDTKLCKNKFCQDQDDSGNMVDWLKAISDEAGGIFQMGVEITSNAIIDDVKVSSAPFSRMEYSDFLNNGE